MSENSMATVENRIAAQQAEAMESGLIDRQDSADLFGNFGDQLLRESHSFGNDPKRAWKMISLASAADVKSGRESYNKPIAVTDYYCHEVELPDQSTGELKRALRTVLYDVSGERYAFVSVGVAFDLFRMTRIFGKGPWKDAPIVVPQQVPTRRGFFITRLMPG